MTEMDNNANPNFDLDALTAEERQNLLDILRSDIENFDVYISGDAPIDELEMPPEVAHRLQNRLKTSISRGDLSASIIRFGTMGFIEVFLAMLNPAVNSRRKRDS